MRKKYLPLQSIKKWSVGQEVKTPPFHGGNTGSSPVRSTKERFKSCRILISVKRSGFLIYPHDIAHYHHR